MTIRRMIAMFAGAILSMTMLSPTSAQQETTTLTGTLTKVGNAYVVDGVEADFGPTSYLSIMIAPADYDGDGVVEALEAEFDGLVGTVISLGGTIGRGDDVDILTVNGAEYRDPTDEPPPWAGGPLRSGVSPGENQGSGGPPAFVSEPPVSPGNGGQGGPPGGRGGPPDNRGGDDD